MSANLNDIFWLNLSKEMLSETFFSLAHFRKCGTVSKEGNLDLLLPVVLLKKVNELKHNCNHISGQNLLY